MWSPVLRRSVVFDSSKGGRKGMSVLFSSFRAAIWRFGAGCRITWLCLRPRNASHFKVIGLVPAFDSPGLLNQRSKLPSDFPHLKFGLSPSHRRVVLLYGCNCPTLAPPHVGCDCSAYYCLLLFVCFSSAEAVILNQRQLAFLVVNSLMGNKLMGVETGRFRARSVQAFVSVGQSNR